jgi:hypothetical protein
LKVKIIHTPPGLGIPEEVRKNWIGIIFEVNEIYFGIGGSFVQSCEELIPAALYFKISSEEALSALREKNLDAWQWFIDNANLNVYKSFLFSFDCCKVKDISEREVGFFYQEKKIKISRSLDIPGVPKEILKKLIGLELKAAGPLVIKDKGLKWVFMASLRELMGFLKKEKEYFGIWKWFFDHKTDKTSSIIEISVNDAYFSRAV